LRYGGLALRSTTDTAPCAYLAALASLHSIVFPISTSQDHVINNGLIDCYRFFSDKGISLSFLTLPPTPDLFHSFNPNPDDSKLEKLQRALNLAIFDNILLTVFPTYSPADKARLVTLGLRDTHLIDCPRGQSIFLLGSQIPT